MEKQVLAWKSVANRFQTSWQTVYRAVEGIVRYDLEHRKIDNVTTYILKELFHKFWEYKSCTWASKFLNNWCELAKDSELEPLDNIVKMLKKHHDLILNYFKAKKEFNSGVVEGMNRKINLTIRKAFGFRSYEVYPLNNYWQDT